MTRNNHPRMGEIYLMNFSGQGNEQKGWRPGLVFQNNTGNQYSPNIIALPLTSALKKSEQVTHVIIPSEGTGLLKDSMVLCENPERMSKDRIGAYLTTLSDEFMEQIAVSYLLATAAISFIDSETLLSAWKKSIELNAIVRDK